jgi:Rho termination factor, N-terminal domain
MNLSDSFYVALCMTVLILGAVYWFWTQNQYILRKMNLLENIVYEMKTALPPSWGSGGFGTFGVAGTAAVPPATESPPIYAPAPGSVMSDDDVDILHEDLSRDLQSVSESPVLLVESASGSAPVPVPAPVAAPVAVSEAIAKQVADDLQPGGVGSGVDEVKSSNPYDGMTLRELRRLGEARGISGASKLTKQALITTLRSTPVSDLSFDNLESGTLDLTEGVVHLG